MRWVFPVLFLCWFAACQRPCDAASCSGCCVEGECVAGTSKLECGSGGQQCLRCTAQERCVSARCEPLPEMDAGTADAGPPVCTCATSCCYPDGSCAPNNGIDACGPVKTFCGTCAMDQRCQAGTCVAAACGGCLDPLGACRSGRDEAACGLDGGVCQACAADQRCVNGACAFTRCDATNCRFGCCMPDLRCETSTGVLACGRNGDRCTACSGAQQCLGGVCQ